MSLPRGAWGVGAGLIALVLLLLLLGAPWPQEPIGPPPPEPVRLPVGEPPLAPPPGALAVPAGTSQDLLERKENFKTTAAAATAAAAVDKRPQPPPLRKREVGIAPKRITRNHLGESAGKGVAKILLVATFQGKPITAPVVIDGQWRGSTPLTLTLDQGSHAIRIDYGGTRVNEFVTNLQGGKAVRLNVALRPASEARGNGPSRHGVRHQH